jgi:hypothetical protein
MEKKRRFVSTIDEKIEQKRLKMNAQKTNFITRVFKGKTFGYCI